MCHNKITDFNQIDGHDWKVAIHSHYTYAHLHHDAADNLKLEA